MTDRLVWERLHDGRLIVHNAPVHTVIGPELLAKADVDATVRIGHTVYKVTGWSMCRGGSLVCRRVEPDPTLDEQCPGCGDRIGHHTHAELINGLCQRGGQR